MSTPSSKVIGCSIPGAPEWSTAQPAFGWPCIAYGIGPQAWPLYPSHVGVASFGSTPKGPGSRTGSSGGLGGGIGGLGGGEGGSGEGGGGGGGGDGVAGRAGGGRGVGDGGGGEGGDGLGGGFGSGDKCASHLSTASVEGSPGGGGGSVDAASASNDKASGAPLPSLGGVRIIGMKAAAMSTAPVTPSMPYMHLPKGEGELRLFSPLRPSTFFLGFRRPRPLLPDLLPLSRSSSSRTHSVSSRTLSVSAAIRAVLRCFLCDLHAVTSSPRAMTAVALYPYYIPPHI